MRDQTQGFYVVRQLVYVHASTHTELEDSTINEAFTPKAQQQAYTKLATQRNTDAGISTELTPSSPSMYTTPKHTSSLHQACYKGHSLTSYKNDFDYNSKTPSMEKIIQFEAHTTTLVWIELKKPKRDERTNEYLKDWKYCVCFWQEVKPSIYSARRANIMI